MARPRIHRGEIGAGGLHPELKRATAAHRRDAVAGDAPRRDTEAVAWAAESDGEKVVEAGVVGSIAG